MMMGYPKTPIPYREDSSVGYGQIFAATAIKANNQLEAHIIIILDYNYNNWKDRKEIWYKLKDDNEYNIRMVTLVFAWGANYDLHYGLSFWNYTDQEIVDMLSRYNGTNSDAAQYGKDVYNCYKIFKQYR